MCCADSNTAGFAGGENFATLSSRPPAANKASKCESSSGTKRTGKALLELFSTAFGQFHCTAGWCARAHCRQGADMPVLAPDVNDAPGLSGVKSLRIHSN